MKHLRGRGAKKIKILKPGIGVVSLKQSKESSSQVGQGLGILGH